MMCPQDDDGIVEVPRGELWRKWAASRTAGWHGGRRVTRWPVSKYRKQTRALSLVISRQHLGRRFAFQHSGGGECSVVIAECQLLSEIIGTCFTSSEIAVVWLAGEEEKGTP